MVSFFKGKLIDEKFTCFPRLFRLFCTPVLKEPEEAKEFLELETNVWEWE